MRNAVIGFILAIILIFTSVAVNSVQSRTIRKNELDLRLSAAMEQSMRILMLEPVYTIHTGEGPEEFAADFIQNLLEGTSSDSEYRIEVLGADTQKGLLDVNVEERFGQAAGTGKVSMRKTILMDRYENHENTYYTVTFCQETALKQMSVHGGDFISDAMLPKSGMEKQGYTFDGWGLRKPDTGIVYTNADIKNLCVTEDMEFEAVYRKNQKEA